MATDSALSPAPSPMASYYPVGKLPHAALARLLEAHIGRVGRDVVVGPAIGEDAAALEIGDRCLVVASDPISFATRGIGHYAVSVNANDVATMGARPRWFVASLLLPPGARDSDVEAIFADIASACEQLDIDWCGGHTEITDQLPRPIVVGTMLGTVARERLLRTADARPGDLIWCTKQVPLEATALLAHERPEWSRSLVGENRWQRCAGLLRRPGISIVAEAMAAAEAGAHALHDPTEGGIATGLHELACAAEVGLRVEAGAIPLDPDGAELCAGAGIDPLGALASGSLLITAPVDRASEIEDAVAAAGVECRRIGEVCGAEAGRVLLRDEEEFDLPRFEVDEIARIFAADEGDPAS